MEIIYQKDNNVINTVNKMIEMLRNPVQLAYARKFVEDILRYTDYSKNKIKDVIRIFNFLKNKVRFLKDIYKVETIKTPKHLIEELKTKGRIVGDCDDLSMLLATFLKVIGYPVRFVITAVGNSLQYNHIYVEVNIDDKWYPLDLTLKLPFITKPYNFKKVFEVI